MNIEYIKKELLKYDEVKVLNYCNYILKLTTEKDRDGKLKNAWSLNLNDQYFVDNFKKVASEKLYIDGDMVSINYNGLFFSFYAYKNLVLMRYPEAKIDLQLVLDGDDFEFIKKDGKVFYSHKLNNPFSNKNIVGGYCIIKNKLGEFIEVMSKDDFEQIRKKAKTDKIWAEWTNEMYLKTIIKRACKRHFKDITLNIDNIDNETNYDLENPIDIELQIKQEIENINDLKTLAEYYNKNKDNVKFKKAFNKLVSKRKLELEIAGVKNENI